MTRPDQQTLDMLDAVFIELKADAALGDEDILQELAVGIECEEGCRPSAALVMAEAYFAGDFG